MQPTGIMLTSNPPVWEHKCNKCELRSNLDAKYPYFKYQEIELPTTLDLGRNYRDQQI